MEKDVEEIARTKMQKKKREIFSRFFSFHFSRASDHFHAH